jgi:murein DD-endopeptidase MepM/ murein hydrolase activator NlpD
VAQDVALLQSARSLAQLVDAQARLAKDQLDALAAQSEQVAKDLDAVNADIAALQARADARRSLHDRIARDALRLIDLPESAIPTDLSDAQRDALEELRSLASGLRAQHGRLEDRTAELARLRDSVGVKRAELDRMRGRAQVLATAAADGDASQRAAEVAVLQQLANDAAGAQVALAQLIASSIFHDAAAAASPWRLPARGLITQGFGPTTFALEPPLVYQGTYYAHFHAALDIAAPFGTPVVAASDGVVTFVGHLSDGAEIVLIAHADGLVSEYAHLDDTFAPPPVKVGQVLKGGQVIGFIGITGITTGPHLHFAVMRAGLAVDPLGVLAKS